MILVEAIVKRTNMKMTDSASVLQEIVKAAADERGEWHLPLTAQQQAAMKQARQDDPTVPACMHTCSSQEC